MSRGMRNTFEPVVPGRVVLPLLSTPVIALFMVAACNGQSPITLTFEGLQDREPVFNYYNGGSGGSGSAGGPNYGIAFGSDAIATITESDGGSGRFSGNPSGVTIVTFLSGPGVVMNVPGGFTTGFSFYYTSGPNAGVVTVYDGLNGTGNVLATFDLAPTGTFCNGSPFYYSCWAQQGIPFNGIAQSVDFTGATDQIGFDNITLGSQTPGTGLPTGPILTVTPSVSSTNSTLTPGFVSANVTVTNSGAAGIYNAAIQGVASGFQIQQAQGGPQAGQSQNLAIGAGEVQTLTVSFDTTGKPPGIYTGTYTATPQTFTFQAFGRGSTRNVTPHGVPPSGGAEAGLYSVANKGRLKTTPAPSPGLIFNLTESMQQQSLPLYVIEEGGFQIPVSSTAGVQSGPLVDIQKVMGTTCPVAFAVPCTTQTITVQAELGSLLDGESATGSVTLDCLTTVPCDNTPLMVAILIDAPAASTITKSLPHFEVGASFVSDFYAVNSGSAPAHFSITFHDDLGNGVQVPFANGIGNVSTLSDTIPAGGSRFYEAGTPNGADVKGSAVITSDPTITIQALFRRQVGDNFYEAAVPAAGGSNEVQVPFDDTIFSTNGNQIYTGLAIANLDTSTPATVNCIARDSGGNVIAGAIPQQMLNPLGHWAAFAFTPLLGYRGTLDCTSNTQIAAIGIRALGTNAISSLPIITLPITNSGGAKTLPHFEVGASFVSDFYAVNSGSTAAHFSISFHDDLGNPVPVPFANGIGIVPTLSDTIPAGGSRFYEAGTPEGSDVKGSAVITSDPTITIQALFRRQVGDNFYEAAVPAAGGSNEVQVPFDDTIFSTNGNQIYTGLAIANLDTSTPATVNCIARDSGGNVIAGAIPQQVLNPLGHWAAFAFTPLLGYRGTLDCTSNTKIAAIGIRALGNNAISSLPIIVP